MSNQIKNSTWLELDHDLAANQKDKSDILYAALLSLILLWLRFILEKYLFVPVGKWLGVKNIKPKKPQQSPDVEKANSRSKNWNRNQLPLSKNSFLRSIIQILGVSKQWLTLTVKNRPTTVTKFNESFWKALICSLIFASGAVVAWKQPWFFKIEEIWSNHQAATPDMRWYFVLYLAWYLCSLVSLSFEARRKDFWMMLVHHLVVLAIIATIWTYNLFRALILTTFVHDNCDIVLEVSKMAMYAGYEKVTLTCSLLFISLWIVTRLGFFPFWMLKYYLLDLPKKSSQFLDFSFFYILVVLQLAVAIFDCVWTYFIFKALRSLSRDKYVRDSRSDDEED